MEWTSVDKQLPLKNLQTGSTSQINLSTEFTFIMDIQWSPTGEQIALALAVENDNISFAVLDLASGREKSLIEPSNSISCENVCFRWSPDGDGLLFLDWDSPTYSLKFLPVGPLIAASELPSEASSLQTGLDFFPRAGYSVSTDGRRFAFAKPTGFDNFWLATLKKGSEYSLIQITDDTARKCCASIAPDGRSVAFVGIYSGISQIFIKDLEPEMTRQLTHLDSIAVAPKWSPDGTKIAFLTMEGKITRIGVIDTVGGGVRLLAESSPTKDAELEWAPGAQILYRKPDNRNYIILNSVSGEESVLMPGFDGWMFNATYSPNGENVALFVNKRDGTWGLLSVSLDNMTEVFLREANLFPRAWSVDSLLIYAADETGKIVGVPLEGGELIELPKLPIDEYFVDDVLATQDGIILALKLREWTFDVWLAEDFGSPEKMKEQQ